MIADYPKCTAAIPFAEHVPDLTSKDDISNIKQAEASILLEANQELLGKYFIFDRQVVEYEQT